MVKALPSSTASVTHLVREMDGGWRMMKQKNSIHEEVSACHAVACDDAVVKACWACAIVRIEFSRCLSGVRSLEG